MSQYVLNAAAPPIPSGSTGYVPSTEDGNAVLIARQLTYGILVAEQLVVVPLSMPAQFQLNVPSDPSESTVTALPAEQKPEDGYPGTEDPLALQHVPFTAGTFETFDELEPSMSAPVELADRGFFISPAADPEEEG